MGMIVTLHLISVNVYNSVNAPANRGFSYIEVWMFGTHCSTFLAMCEYGFVLYLKKVTKKSDDIAGTDEFNKRIQCFDFKMMLISFVFFLMFSSVYWMILLLSWNKYEIVTCFL